MRKAKASAAKDSVAPKNVDEYIASVPEPARSNLNKIRATIRAAAPSAATEAISYRMPTFKYKGPLVGFAAFTNHCGFYPMSPRVMEALQQELKDFQTTKGTIRFPLDKPLPATLVRKLVKARVAENERKPG